MTDTRLEVPRFTIADFGEVIQKREVFSDRMYYEFTHVYVSPISDAMELRRKGYVDGDNASVMHGYLPAKLHLRK